MNYRLSEFAAEDLHEILKHYALVSRALKGGFIHEVSRSFALLIANPYLGQGMTDRYRRVPLRRFPYNVVYQVEKSGRQVSVVAISHQSRRPGYWQNRIQEEPAIYQLAA